jgi:hypothetical protein
MEMMPAPILPRIIVDETATSHEPIMISGKHTSAVQETLYLLAVPGMRESIKAGMAEPLVKSAKALKWRA